MTLEQKNLLLATLSQFKADLFKIYYNSTLTSFESEAQFSFICGTIDRNLTSIEKQIKRL